MTGNTHSHKNVCFQVHKAQWRQQLWAKNYCVFPSRGCYRAPIFHLDICVFVVVFASLRTCSLSLSHTLLYIRPNTIRYEIYFHWSANGTTNKNLPIELLERVRLFLHLSENQRILFPSQYIDRCRYRFYSFFLSFQFAITMRYDLILFSVEKKSFDCSIYGRNVGK